MKEYISRLNAYGAKKEKILFIIDFDRKIPLIYPLDAAKNKGILFDIEGVKNYKRFNAQDKPIEFEKKPVEFEEYKKAFDEVIKEFIAGNTFLLNLTFPTRIYTNLTLKEIFYKSRAKYKLYVKDKFSVFSPESFVVINGNKISSFPMKGTIDASLPDARNKILSNAKELAEHTTIVDLIRNDLSMVSKNVRVDDFRYIEEIVTHNKRLLQVSSRITGELASGWQSRLGNIIDKLLPAGSISGAPKTKTVEIIKRVENYDRGYFSGIFGIFDGESLNSGVMIRFIEKAARPATPISTQSIIQPLRDVNDSGLTFKSGGGITVYSDARSEYNEMLDKVYVPISPSE